MLRSPLASERIQMHDPRTGIKVIQLTSYPLPSAHFLYDWPSITPDNQWVLFFSQRFAQRNAPWDLFRCDADGLNLYQLTERSDAHESGGYYGRSASIMALDGKVVYMVWGVKLCAVDVESGRVEELCSLERYCPPDVFVSRLHISASGRRLFIDRAGNVSSTLRLDLDTGAIDEINFGGRIFGCMQTENRVVVHRGVVQYDVSESTDGARTIVNTGSEITLWSADEDSGDSRYICPFMFAHATLLGKKAMLQGCGRPPHHCIWVVEEGKDPYKLVEGPYFWHSGASYDGEWIIADTNWPDMGLQLVHVPSRRFRTLCHAGATQDHIEYGHPHPALSQDGRPGGIPF